MSFPNQQMIFGYNRQPRDDKHIFAVINIDALRKAMKTLSGAALDLWLYINKNQDNYRFELSPKACEEYGIKKDSYYRGKQELFDKHYLVPVYKGSNKLIFYENGDGITPLGFSEDENDYSSDNANNCSKNLSLSENKKDNASKNAYSPSKNQTKVSENHYRNNTDNTNNNTLFSSNNYLEDNVIYVSENSKLQPRPTLCINTSESKKKESENEKKYRELQFQILDGWYNVSEEDERLINSHKLSYSQINQLLGIKYFDV